MDHAAVDTLKGALDALDDRSGLRLSAFCFFYRQALVHPAEWMIAVILQPYAILYLCLGESALCLRLQVEAELSFACHNSS